MFNVINKFALAICMVSCFDLHSCLDMCTKKCTREYDSEYQKIKNDYSNTGVLPAFPKYKNNYVRSAMTQKSEQLMQDVSDNVMYALAIIRSDGFIKEYMDSLCCGDYYGALNVLHNNIIKTHDKCKRYILAKIFSFHCNFLFALMNFYKTDLPKKKKHINYKMINNIINDKEYLNIHKNIEDYCIFVVENALEKIYRSNKMCDVYIITKTLLKNKSDEEINSNTYQNILHKRNCALNVFFVRLKWFDGCCDKERNILYDQCKKLLQQGYMDKCIFEKLDGIYRLQESNLLLYV